MESSKKPDKPLSPPAGPRLVDLDRSRLLRLSLRATQPLRVIESARGPVFRLDFEKVAAQRAAATAARRAAAPGRSPAAPARRPPPGGRAYPLPAFPDRSRPARAVGPAAPQAARAPSKLPPAGRQKPQVPRGPLPRGQARRLNNRYQLLEKLGEGGAGVVYKAEDQFLDMPVAVKVLHSNISHDKQAIASLKEEARIAMRLSHQHIVHLHNLEKAGSSHYLVMEYIKGSTFRELLTVYGHLPLDTVIATLRVCSNALSYAHRNGVLHNDLKPENLLITDDGVLKVIDFGISCLINTRQGDYIMGTPAYMSPEQIRGETLDKRTDVYSLGIITYEFLTGKTPFPENVGLDDILRLLPAQLPKLPDEIRPIVQKAVDPDREKRWETVEAFVASFINESRPLLRQLTASAPKSPA